MVLFPKEEYYIPFFKDNNFQRKLCPKCDEYFWTKNKNQINYGESSTKGCSNYSFISNPPIKKSFNLNEMREAFLSFFEKCVCEVAQNLKKFQKLKKS